MKFILILLGLTLAAGAGAFTVEESSRSVVVVYNSAMAESKGVADHYAAMRKVPPSQVIGFNLPTKEIMSRKEYDEELEKPLAKFLDEQKLLVFEPDTSRTNLDARKIKKATIRYIVLCYGVPLRIAEEPGLHEPGEEQVRQEFRRNGAAVDSELALLPWPDPHRMLASATPNPLYAATNAAWFQPYSGLFMVARLDGPDATIARGLVDKAMQAETDGLWGRAYFDTCGLPKNDRMIKGDDSIKGAANAAGYYGFDIVVDHNPKTFTAGFPMSQMALYAGWYDSDVSGPFTQPNVEIMPGAFAYHLHSYSAQTLRSTNTHWCGPLLAKGVAATMGCVDEPYLDGTPNIGVFFALWLGGFTFGEAAYASQPVLSWQTTVIGDPLYQPFGKDPRILHEALANRHSPMLDWSHVRVVNLSLNHGLAPSKAVEYLQQIGTTSQSAVLTEKLGDMYLMEGQSELALKSWQQALALKPTPLQAVRLTFDLADQFAATGQGEKALATYDAFLKQNPNYPDALSLYQKMEPLAQKLHRKTQARFYESEISRLAASPSAGK